MGVMIDYGDDTCVASIGASSKLVEVSFAVESVVSYFLGRGVHRYECTRTKQNGNCVLNFNALVEPQDMQFSKVATIRTAVENRYFPKSIAVSDRFQNEDGFDKLVRDGQHRHKTVIVGQKKDQNTTTTIIEQHDANLDYPILLMTYGLADLFTGLFALNIKYIKWQGSVDTIQCYFKHNLSDAQISRFLYSKVDYDINLEVSKLG